MPLMTDTDKDNLFAEMPLGDHLEELRSRIIYAAAGLAVGTFVCLFFGKFLIDVITGPYYRITEKMGIESTLLVLAPVEGFMSYLKICLVAGLSLSSPWVFYHLWAFVAAGLYYSEKKYVYMLVPACAILFVLGTVFCIFVATPVTLEFFIRFNRAIYKANSAFNVQSYINYVVALTLVFGLAFQTPMVVFVINRIGLISLVQLRKWRKYVVLVVFVIAAVITPPGPVIQLVLAAPMYLLYELGILLCRFNRQREV